MGLLKETQKAYYQSNNLGNYQFTSLDDIINQFLIAYVGEDKIISKIKRADVVFHAQRAMQELSFDTFKSIKSQQIDVPPTLVMPLPHDYVNYTKLTWADSAGIKHPLYPTNRTSNPFEIRQDDDGAYSFPEDLQLISNNDFSVDFNPPWIKAGGIGALDALYNPGMAVSGGSLKFSYVTKNGAGATDWAHALTAYQEIDTTNLTYLDISADGVADTITEGVGTVRFGLSTNLPDSNLRNNTGTSSPTQHPVTTNIDATMFDLLDASGNPSYVEWIGPTSVGSTSSTETKTGIDVTGVNKVYAIIVAWVDTTSTITYATSKRANSIDNVSVTNTLASEYLQTPINKETESSTWSNYKSTTPSENNNDDYEDDTYWPVNGERYGLDPQHAQVNGSFFIDQRLGKIHFSSNISGKTIILDYISDGLGTDEEMQVHKFAEEAMYKSILCAIMSAKANVGRNQLIYYKKDKFAAIRQAKLRLSNIKLEELTQVLRGKSKWIKH